VISDKGSGIGEQESGNMKKCIFGLEGYRTGSSNPEKYKT
jgi:hypothetical protein